MASEQLPAASDELVAHIQRIIVAHLDVDDSQLVQTWLCTPSRSGGAADAVRDFEDGALAVLWVTLQAGQLDAQSARHPQQQPTRDVDGRIVASSGRQTPEDAFIDDSPPGTQLRAYQLHLVSDTTQLADAVKQSNTSCRWVYVASTHVLRNTPIANSTELITGSLVLHERSVLRAVTWLFQRVHSSSHRARTQVRQQAASQLIDASSDAAAVVALAVAHQVEPGSTLTCSEAASMLNTWLAQADDTLIEADMEGMKSKEGPRDVLLYWRSRAVSCQGLLESMQAPPVLAAYGLLRSFQAANPLHETIPGVLSTGPTLPHARQNIRVLLADWDNLRKRLHEAAVEAQDNTKHLESLRVWFDGLYDAPVSKLSHLLPITVESIGRLVSVAPFYGLQHRVAVLFRLVANQLVTRCKRHIMTQPALDDASSSNSSSKSAADLSALKSGIESAASRVPQVTDPLPFRYAALIMSSPQQQATLRATQRAPSTSDPAASGAWVFWKLPADAVLQRLQECVSAMQVFKSAFYDFRESLRATQAGSTVFDFDDQAVFQRLDDHSERFEQLSEMLLTIQRFSALHQCRAIHMRSIETKLSKLLESLASRDYDPLDPPEQVPRSSPADKHTAAAPDSPMPEPLLPSKPSTHVEHKRGGLRNHYLSAGSPRKAMPNDARLVVPGRPDSPPAARDAPESPSMPSKPHDGSSSPRRRPHPPVLQSPSSRPSSARHSPRPESHQSDKALFATPLESRLSPQSQSFEHDWTAFQTMENDLLQDLSAQLRSLVRGRGSTHQLLQLLHDVNRFDIATVPVVATSLPALYKHLMNRFAAELDTAAEMYEQHKLSPPNPRSVPPIVGRILWARQLFRSIDQPLTRMVECLPQHLVQTPTFSAIVQRYQTLSSVLIKFEFRWRQGWCDAVLNSRIGLQSPVLAANQTTHELLVNMDPTMHQLLKEARALSHLGVNLPESIRIVCECGDSMTLHGSALQEALQLLQQVQQTVPIAFLPAIQPLLVRLRHAMDIGTSTVTWGSTNVPAFVKAVAKAARFLYDLALKVRDIMDRQVHPAIASIASQSVLSLVGFVGSDLQIARAPSAEALTSSSHISRESALVIHVHAFLLAATDQLNASGGLLAAANATAESGARQISRLILSTYQADSDEYNTALAVCSQVMYDLECLAYGHIKSRVLDALNQFRVRLAPPTGVSRFLHAPLFRSTVQLLDGHPALTPDLFAIQQGINKVARALVHIPEAVARWGPVCPVDTVNMHDPSAPAAATAYDTFGTGHRLLALVLQLSGTLQGFQWRVHQMVVQFEAFQRLWLEDPVAGVEAAVGPSPTLQTFADLFAELDSMKADLQSRPQVCAVDSLAVDIGPIVQDLCERIDARKAHVGLLLGRWAETIAGQLEQFFVDALHNVQAPCISLTQLNDFMENLASLRAMEAAIELKLVPIGQAHDLLRLHSLPLPSQDEARLSSLATTWDDLKRTLVAVQARLQTAQPKFRSMLVGDWRLLVANVQQLHEEWQNSGLHAATLPISEHLRTFAIFASRLRALQTQHDQLLSSGRVFGRKILPLPALSSMQQEFDSLHQVLMQASRTEACLEKHRQCLWTDIDLDQMSAEMTQQHARLNRLPESVQHFPAYTGLQLLVAEVRGVIPLLSLLAQPYVKRRHWLQLETAMEISLPQSTTATVGSLMQTPLLAHRVAVETITGIAKKEAEIEAKINSIRELWSSKQFEVSLISERGTLGLTVLHTSSLLAMLDDSQVTLSGIQSSRFHLPFAKEVATWTRRLTLIRDIIEPWTNIQSSLLYLEAVFASEEITSQLPVVALKFSQVVRTWSRLMSRVGADPGIVQVCCNSDILRRPLPDLGTELETCQHALAGYLLSKRRKFPRFFFLSDASLLGVLANSTKPALAAPQIAGMFEGCASFITEPEDPSRIRGVRSRAGEVVVFPPAAPVVATAVAEEWLAALTVALQDAVAVSVSRAVTVAVLAAQRGTSPLQAYPLALAEAAAWFAAHSSGASVDWLTDFLGQVCLLSYRLLFTAEAEQAIQQSSSDTHSLRKLSSLWDSRTQELMAIAASASSAAVPQSPCVEALIAMCISFRDIIVELIAKRPKTASAFVWQSQLRAYFAVHPDVASLAKASMAAWGDRPTGQASLQVCDAKLAYGSEFTAGTCMVVITPLTMRCYMALMQAVSLGFGGSPIGPSGTGKTESIKSLAHAVGRMVLVFNCSTDAGTDVITRLIMGAASSGVWVSLDEIHRVRTQILSTAAVLLHSVLCAVRVSAVSARDLTGLEFPIHSHVGVLATFHPSCCAAGTLPSNLRNLLRTIAMIEPDAFVIAKVILTCKGFANSSTLASRIDCLFRFARQECQTSNAALFGLRSIVAVCRAAVKPLPQVASRSVSMADASPSRTKSAAASAKQVAAALLQAENAALLAALLRLVQPGLSRYDQQPFQELVAAIYPNSAARSVDGADFGLPSSFRAVLADAAGQIGVCCTESCARLAAQCAAILTNRTGVILCGPPGAGKSVLLQLLAQTCSRVEGDGASDMWGKLVKRVVIFPRAIPSSQLFGRQDESSREWNDGVIARAWRRATAADSWTTTGLHAEASWLVFDGPMDPTWAESLNTALDDTQALTLANGDRLPVAKGMRLIFETDDLSFTSPATISRCGLVAVDARLVTWVHVLQAWCATRPLMEARRLLLLFGGYFDPIIAAWALCLPHSHKYQRTSVHSSMSTIAANVLSATAALVGAMKLHRSVSEKDAIAAAAASSSHSANVQTGDLMSEAEAAIWGRCFVLVLVQVLCDSFTADQRQVFQTQLRQLQPALPSLNEMEVEESAWARGLDSLPSWPEGAIMPKLDLPSEDLHSVFIDEQGQWQTWSSGLSAPPVGGRAAGVLMNPWSIALAPLRATQVGGDVPVGMPFTTVTGHVLFTPTAGFAQAFFMLSLHAIGGRALVLAGSSATGKSILASAFQSRLVSASMAARKEQLRRELQDSVCPEPSQSLPTSEPRERLAALLSDTVFLSRGLAMWRGASLMELETRVEGMLDRKLGRMFVPPSADAIVKGDASPDAGGTTATSRVLLLIDDVGLAPVDSLGLSEVKELLRQIVAESGYHSAAQAGAWTHVRGIQPFMTLDLALAHPDMGTVYKPVAQEGLNSPGNTATVRSLDRFYAQCAVVHLLEQSDVDLIGMYECNLQHWFSSAAVAGMGFASNAISTIKELPVISLALFHQLRRAFPPSPATPFCRFDLRHVGKILSRFLRVRGLCRTHAIAHLSAAQITPAAGNSSCEIMALWWHEVQREFGDALPAPLGWLRLYQHALCIVQPARASVAGANDVAGAIGKVTSLCQELSAAPALVDRLNAMAPLQAVQFGLDHLACVIYDEMCAYAELHRVGTGNSVWFIPNRSNKSSSKPTAPALGRSPVAYCPFLIAPVSAGELETANREAFGSSYSPSATSGTQLAKDLLLYPPSLARASLGLDGLGAVTELSEAPVVSRLHQLLEWYADPKVLPAPGQHTALERKKSDVVLFTDAVEHICCVARILSQPGRHALLLGIGGSGRHTVARVAAFSVAAHFCELSTLKTVEQQVELLKIVCMEAACKNRRTVVCVQESDLQSRDVVSALSTIAGGNCASLFTADELAGVIVELNASGREELQVGVDESDDLQLDRPETLHRIAFNAAVSGRINLCYCVAGTGDSGSAAVGALVHAHRQLFCNATLRLFSGWSPDARAQVADPLLAQQCWYGIPWSSLEEPDDRDKDRFDNVSAALSAKYSGQGREQQLRSHVLRFLTTAHLVPQRARSQAFQGSTRSQLAALTPQVFFSLLTTFADLSVRKYQELNLKVEQLDRGLRSISVARGGVGVMEADLAAKEQQLILKGKQLEAMLIQIEMKTLQAEAEKLRIVEQRALLAVQSKQVARDLETVQVKLAEAEPAMRRALESLKRITPADVSTVRTFARPPNLIKRIMDGVLILRQLPLDPVTPDPEFDDGRFASSWSHAFKMVSNFQFLSALSRFDRNTVNDETMELLAPYLEFEDFDEEFARRSCGNMAGLCTWVKGMVTWYAVSKSVRPLQMAVEEAQERMAATTRELAAAEREVQRVERHVQDIQAEYAAAVAAREALNRELDQIRRKLQAAAQLLSSLGSEQTQWTAERVGIRKAMSTLLGDCLLTSCSLVLGSAALKNERSEWIGAWADALKQLNVRCTDQFSVPGFLIDRNVRIEWQLQGLATDDASVESALMAVSAIPLPQGAELRGHAQSFGVTESLEELGTAPQGASWTSQARYHAIGGNRVVLIQDTHSRCLEWLKRGPTGQVKVVSAMLGVGTGPESLMSAIQCAMEAGHLLVLTDVSPQEDDAGPSATHWHCDRFTGAGVSVSVCFGFGLVLTTFHDIEAFEPDDLSHCRVVNFATTRQGLEEFMLSRVVVHEKTEIETQRRALEEANVMIERRLEHLRRLMLDKLANAQGSLLDDLQLLTVLNEIKATVESSRAKAESLQQAAMTLNNARNVFVPVARAASCLFAVWDTVGSQPENCRPSLKLLLSVFDKAMNKATASRSASLRVDALCNSVVTWICSTAFRSLRAHCHPVFALLAGIQLDVANGRVAPVEVFALQRLARWNGSEAETLDELGPPSNRMSWISARTMGRLLTLRVCSDLRSFLGMLRGWWSGGGGSFTEEARVQGWKAWFRGPQPERVSPPEVHYGEDTTWLSSFQRMLVLMATRRDRSFAAANEYLLSHLDLYGCLQLRHARRVGQGGLAGAVDDAGRNTPLVLLSGPNEDPADDIHRLAAERSVAVWSMSATDSNAEVVLHRLKTAVATNHWFVLHNVDNGGEGLASAVEKAVAALEPADLSRSHQASFQLFLVAGSAANMPTNLSRISVPVVLEVGGGMRTGIQRCFAELDERAMQSADAPEKWRRLVFVMAAMHALLRNRGQAGVQSWCNPMQFGDADWQISVQYMLRNCRDTDALGGIDWVALKRVVSDIFFGGQAVCPQDARMVRALAELWLQPSALAGEDVRLGAHGVVSAERYHSGTPVPRGAAKTLADMREFLEVLPAGESPEAFCLPLGMAVRQQVEDGRSLLAAVSELPTGALGIGKNIHVSNTGYAGSGGSTQGAEPVLLRTGLVAELLDFVEEQLEALIGSPMAWLNGRGVATDSDAAYRAFIQEELGAMVGLLQRCLEDCMELLECEESHIAPNAKSLETQQELAAGRVSEAWKWSNSSLELHDWQLFVAASAKQLRQWCDLGVPNTIWIGGLRSAHGLLLALKKCAVLAHESWSLDRMKIAAEMAVEAVRSKPTELLLSGLQLEGAAWDAADKQLIELEGDAITSPAPLIRILVAEAGPTEQPQGSLQVVPDEGERLVGSRKYAFQCPLFTSTHRSAETLLLTVKLQSSVTPFHWVLLGTALVCPTPN